MNEHDKFCKQLLKQGDPQELRSWIKSDPSNTLGLLQTNKRSVHFVEKIYTLGAVKAYGVEIDGLDDTGKLVVELPEKAEQRKELFKWAARIARREGFDPTKDEGQRFLFVMMD